MITALAAEFRAPAVIHHHRILHRRLVVQPGEKLGASPHGPGIVPLAVSPYDLRLVTNHKFLKLRKVHIVDESVYVVFVVERMTPFQQGVVESHVKPRGAYRIRQFSAYVTFRPHGRRIEIRRLCGRPERETLMVF